MMNSTLCRDYKSNLVPNGKFFKSDKCRICLCSNGTNVLCTAELCTPPPNCIGFVRRTDECCNFGCPTASTTHIKVISLETDSVKQGARFGATALTVSLIVSLFIFMLMRLRRRQAILNSLSQRADENIPDGLRQLRRMLRGRGTRAQQPYRSHPSTADFIHFLPSSLLSITIGYNHASLSSDPRDVSHLLLSVDSTLSPPEPPRPNVPRPPSYESVDFAPSLPEPSSPNVFSFRPPSYESLSEKNEDWPPPYSLPPPPYSETYEQGEWTDQIMDIDPPPAEDVPVGVPAQHENRGGS